MARVRGSSCPECGAPMRAGEQGPCAQCRPAGRRGRSRQGGTGKGLSPVALGILIGGGLSVLLVGLLLALRGGKAEQPAAPPAPAPVPAVAKDPPPPPPDPQAEWSDRKAEKLARFARLKAAAPGLVEEFKAFRREAISMGDREAVAELLDHWLRLLPDDEEARGLRGDVLYKGPFRRRFGGRWIYAKEPRTGEETRIWLTREEHEALEADVLYRQALEGKDTADRIGAQGGGKVSTWFFFDDEVAPRPFFVCSRGPTPAFAKDRAISVVRTLAGLRRTMLADYAESMVLGPGRKEPLIPVYVFSSADDYDDFRKTSSIQGFPDPALAAGFFTWNEALRPVGWLFVWSKNPEDAFFKEVISHEGTHLLHYQYTNPSSQAWGTRSDGTTTWFQEGLAEYWGGHSAREVDGVPVFLPGRMLTGRFDHLWRYLPHKVADIPDQEPRFMPLREMCRTSYSSYHQVYDYRSAQGDPAAREMVGLFYAQGWAFVHFLMHGAGGRYRPAILRYMRTELEASFAWRELEKALGKPGKEGWDQLTQEFIDYVRKELRPIRVEMEKSGGYGAWAEEEARRLAAAMRKREGGAGE